mgnify:CR=1 FL=1
MIKRLSVISLALVLAACGSSTKLDENAAGAGTVSYTHLTLPTSDLV